MQRDHWQYVDDGIKFINIRCINNGSIDTSTANKISYEEAYGKYRHFLLEPYDIVIGSHARHFDPQVNERRNRCV